MAPSFVTTNKSVAGEITPPLVLQKHTRQFRHIMVNFKEMEVGFGVRFGSGTEIQAHQPQVRFTPKADITGRDENIR